MIKRRIYSDEHFDNRCIQSRFHCSTCLFMFANRHTFIFILQRDPAWRRWSVDIQSIGEWTKMSNDSHSFEIERDRQTHWSSVSTIDLIEYVWRQKHFSIDMVLASIDNQFRCVHYQHGSGVTNHIQRWSLCLQALIINRSAIQRINRHWMAQSISFALCFLVISFDMSPTRQRGFNFDPLKNEEKH